MSAAILAAMCFTVLLLVTTAYFILGSIPLLILKHDTPLDARFVRGFFNIYYVAAFVAATAACVSYLFAGRPALAIGAAGLALVAVALRRLIIPRMESLGSQIQSSDMAAVPGFRKIHIAAIFVNIAQLAAIVWTLIVAGR
jgi:hypothetical protein